jgi:pimeloyl-ACP methyl ester carboxylesterase
MAEIERKHVRAPDGRTIEVLAMSSQARWTLVYHSASPHAPVPFPQLEAAATARGIRLVQYARPGYGDSARKIGRRVADAAADVRAILDSLDIERFLVLGWSGGGSHALACAALLPDRVAAASTIASMAPYGSAGLDFFANMDPANVRELKTAITDPNRVQFLLETYRPGLAAITASDIVNSPTASVEDQALMKGPFAVFLADALRRAVSGGIWGWYDDDLATIRGWGFDVGSIRVPVTIWHGEKDHDVPVAHGRWLASHIPGVRSQLLPDHSHVSLVAVALDQILDDLLDRADGKM